MKTSHSYNEGMKPMFQGLLMLTKWLTKEGIRPKYPSLDELMAEMPSLAPTAPKDLEPPSVSVKRSPKMAITPTPAQSTEAEKPAPPAEQPWEMTREEYATYAEVQRLISRIRGIGLGAVRRQMELGWTDAQLANWARREGFMPMATPDEVAVEVIRQLRPSVNVASGMAKEPWEMTRKEYVQQYAEEIRQQGPAQRAAYRASIGKDHKMITEKALAEGKPVPPEVLTDYPDLVKAARPLAAPEAAPGLNSIEMPMAETKPKIGTSCIPCSINHLSTCSGLLSEALRFARTDGLASSEVVDRLGLCQDEINAMERVDLRAENIVKLEPQERELARELLIKTRSLRHKLEHLDNVSGLEELTAGTQSLRTEIGKKWLLNKFESLPPEQQVKIKHALLQQLSPPQS